MGAFEFDNNITISARNCNCNDNDNAGESCIIAQKVFDQCRIQKCLSPDILGPARTASNGGQNCNEMLCGGDIIVPPCNASDVSICDLELSRIDILRKKHNSLQKGCWDVELRYVFDYTLEFRRSDGCHIGCIDATSTYNLKVTLFGSEEAEITSATDMYSHCNHSEGGPFILSEGKGLALSAELKYPGNHRGCGCGCGSGCGCGCDNGMDAAMGAPISVNVTIGLFTIVKLYRTVSIIVESMGRCLPGNSASLNPGDPCANFDALSFPLDAFSPSAEPRSCCAVGNGFSSPFCESTNNNDCNNGCNICNCNCNRNCC